MKKSKSQFLGKVSSDAKRQKTQGSNYGYLRLPKGINVFSPEPGKRAKFDIIPYLVSNPKHPNRNTEEGIAVPGSLWYKRPFRVHRNVGVANDAVICLSSFGKKCPICEYRSKRQKEGAEKEELKALNSTQRNLYCIIPIDNKTSESVPHILDISQFLFQDKINAEIEENSEYEIFMDLEEGLTLNVRFLSSTMGTSKPFAEAGRIDFDKRKEQYDESILEDVPDLDTLLMELSYKELETKFFEMEDEVKGEDEEEPTVRKRKVAIEEEDEPEDKPIRKRRVVEEEDEPEDKPIRKRRVVEEEEPEEEPEEEEEQPRKKSAALPLPDENKGVKRARKNVHDPIICVACQGTGKNSRGKQCPICQGTGVKSDPDSYFEGEEDEKEEIVVPYPKHLKPIPKEEPVVKQKKDKCPYGHRFGVDTEDFKE